MIAVQAVAPSRPCSGTVLWNACLNGNEPAESLSTRDREDLVLTLVGAGWSDVDIAVHTRMTTYTTVRIRERVIGARVDAMVAEAVQRLEVAA